MFEELNAGLDHFRKRGIPGYTCMIMQHGKCIFKRSDGYLDTEGKLPVTGDEHYYIYSCSKPITVTAAMQLWEKGLFSLEDRLSDYLPEFAGMKVRTPEGLKDAEKPILIRHLFEMTAGLNYDLRSPSLLRLREDTQGACPTREAMKYLAQEPLDFEPGAHWQYSLCHDVLAALVEVLSGQRFGKYVKEHVFEPAGMKDSSFLLAEHDLTRVAPLYRYDAPTGQLIPCRSNAYILGSEYESGGAGCISTAADYIRFLEALREGERLLKRDTIRLMTVDRLSAEQTETFWNKDTHGYGLGMRCPKAGGTRTDYGWGGAAGAYLAVDPARDLSFFYVQHVLTAPIKEERSWLYDQAMKGVC